MWHVHVVMCMCMMRPFAGACAREGAVQLSTDVVLVPPCALSALAILGDLEWTDEPRAAGARARPRARSSTRAVDVDAAARFVAACRNFDGGFGAEPGAESHAGQVFCCVGALAIAGRLELVDAPLLGWWLAERQCDSGGLNGRPEKQADVCYSWWVLSALCLLQREQWVDAAALRTFILACQDEEHGGISDKPGACATPRHHPRAMSLRDVR